MAVTPYVSTGTHTDVSTGWVGAFCTKCKETHDLYHRVPDVDAQHVFANRYSISLKSRSTLYMLPFLAKEICNGSSCQPRESRRNILQL